MNLDIIYKFAIVLILVSVQYTLNLILNEIRQLKIDIRKYEQSNLKESEKAYTRRYHG